jgi:hypothetical protein
MAMQARFTIGNCFWQWQIILQWNSGQPAIINENQEDQYNSQPSTEKYSGRGL